MGKRRGKKFSSTLTWKVTKGFFQLFFFILLKATPLIFFGAVGFGLFWGIRQNLYADPGFSIQRLEILPEKGLQHAAQKELERLYLGQNLLQVSPAEVTQVVRRNTKIRTAHVTREFPNALRIEIVERNPFLQLQAETGGYYYSAAEDGIILDVDAARNPELLLFEAVHAQGKKWEVGRELSIAGLKEGVQLVQAFARHPLAQSERLDRVRLDHLGNVSLVLKDGPELRMGRNPLKKFYMLDTIVPFLKGEERGRIVYFELQYKDLIIKKK